MGCSVVNIEMVAFDLALPGIVQTLSPAEARRAGGMTNPLMRNRYVRTRSLVRAVLGMCLKICPKEINFGYGEEGKPRIIGVEAPVEFSISHSVDILVVVTSDVSVGVDVEIRRPRRNVSALAKRFFSAADFAILCETAEGGREELFLRQWVAKEAALKAIGSGLGQELRRAVCDYRDARIEAVRCAAGRVPVAGFDLPDGTPGALAWLGGGAAVMRWRDPGEFTA